MPKGRYIAVKNTSEKERHFSDNLINLFFLYIYKLESFYIKVEVVSCGICRKEVT